MALLETKSSFRSKLAQLGRGTLHALFPNDVEAYLLALELVDSQGATIDYFAWPILPDEISDTHSEATSVVKTFGGTHTNKTSTFTPRNINLRGTFGRDFKVLLGGQEIVAFGFSLSIRNGKFNINPPNLLDNPVPQLSSFVKNGYGCVKILEAIKEKSKKVDSFQKPYSLYFYNPILGNNYQVEIKKFTTSQDVSRNNMIPHYSLELIATAPLESIISRRANIGSAIKNLTISYLQKTANSLASNLRFGLGL